MLLNLQKPTPHVLVKEKRDKLIEKLRREVKAAVFARDRGRCRVCGGKAYEMHELRFRSLGGKRSLSNSVAVCDFRGMHCHRKLQTLVIKVARLHAKLGANGIVAFRQDGRVWFSAPGETPQ